MSIKRHWLLFLSIFLFTCSRSDANNLIPNLVHSFPGYLLALPLIIVVEGLIGAHILGCGKPTALWIALRMNLHSTVIGLLQMITYHLVCLFLFGLFASIFLSDSRPVPSTGRAEHFLQFDFSWSEVLMQATVFSILPDGAHLPKTYLMASYASLGMAVPYFFLTLYCEFKYVKNCLPHVSTTQLKQWILRANAASYSVLIVVLFGLMYFFHRETFNAMKFDSTGSILVRDIDPKYDSYMEYQGTSENGKAHGYGTATWTHHGRIYMAYTGEFDNGHFSGNGILEHEGSWAEFTVYQGQWDNGRMHGRGVLYSLHSCEIIKGTWFHGKMVGIGTVESPKHLLQAEWTANRRTSQSTIEEYPETPKHIVDTLTKVATDSKWWSSSWEHCLR